ncbi:MAG: hypothetical protein HY319_09295 [Armatimonadetes bacterium]|nr:hypothetical protein [Armatimonadota bacterium]
MELLKQIASDLGLEYRSGKDGLALMQSLTLVQQADNRGAQALEHLQTLEKNIQATQGILGSLESFLPGALEDLVGAATGMWDGLRIILCPEKVQRQEGQVMACAMFPLPLEVRIHIYSEGVGSRLGKLLGLQDVQLGNPALDSLVIIKADNPAAAQGVLQDRQLQEALIRLYRGWPTAVLNQLSVRASIGADRQNLLALLEEMKAVARGLGR